MGEIGFVVVLGLSCLGGRFRWREGAIGSGFVWVLSGSGERFVVGSVNSLLESFCLFCCLIFSIFVFRFVVLCCFFLVSVSLSSLCCAGVFVWSVLCWGAVKITFPPFDFSSLKLLFLSGNAAGTGLESEGRAAFSFGEGRDFFGGDGPSVLRNSL